MVAAHPSIAPGRPAHRGLVEEQRDGLGGLGIYLEWLGGAFRLQAGIVDEHAPRPTPTCGPHPTELASRSRALTGEEALTRTRLFGTCHSTRLVLWWTSPTRVTLHRIPVSVFAETYRDAGHADIIRELID